MCSEMPDIYRRKKTVQDAVIPQGLSDEKVDLYMMRSINSDQGYDVERDYISGIR